MTVTLTAADVLAGAYRGLITPEETTRIVEALPDATLLRLLDAARTIAAAAETAVIARNTALGTGGDPQPIAEALVGRRVIVTRHARYGGGTTVGILACAGRHGVAIKGPGVLLAHDLIAYQVIQAIVPIDQSDSSTGGERAR